MFIRHYNKTAELQPLEYCNLHPVDTQSSILLIVLILERLQKETRGNAHSHNLEHELFERPLSEDEAHLPPRLILQILCKVKNRDGYVMVVIDKHLIQTHGQFTTENIHIKGQQSEQAIHTNSGGIMTKSPVDEQETALHLCRNGE